MFPHFRHQLCCETEHTLRTWNIFHWHSVTRWPVTMISVGVRTRLMLLSLTPTLLSTTDCRNRITHLEIYGGGQKEIHTQSNHNLSVTSNVLWAAVDWNFWAGKTEILHLSTIQSSQLSLNSLCCRNSDCDAGISLIVGRFYCFNSLFT